MRRLVIRRSPGPGPTSLACASCASSPPPAGGMSKNYTQIKKLMFTEPQVLRCNAAIQLMQYSLVQYSLVQYKDGHCPCSSVQLSLSDCCHAVQSWSRSPSTAAHSVFCGWLPSFLAPPAGAARAAAEAGGCRRDVHQVPGTAALLPVLHTAP